METIILQEDIKVFYITAKSFPNDILDAHKELHRIIPFSKERRYFGVSRPEQGIIVYKAAVEELEEDKEIHYNCQSLVIGKGKYRCITILNFMKDPQSIGKAFEELISYSDLDPFGYCIEWYFNDKDVKCLVKTSHND
jgi:hypothetical protein